MTQRGEKTMPLFKRKRAERAKKEETNKAEKEQAEREIQEELDRENQELEKEQREEEDKKRKAYFELPKYPSNRKCWSCGLEDGFEEWPVELEFGEFLTERYNGRRYLKVKCPRCGASYHERMVSPASESETNPGFVKIVEDSDLED